MKKCPFCAQEIQDDAIKCRFCGEFLKKKWWKNCFFSCLIAFVVTILFIYFTFFMLKFVTYKIFFAVPNSPHYHPPFTGQGIEGILKEFGEIFKALCERFRELFQSGAQNYNRITF